MACAMMKLWSKIGMVVKRSNERMPKRIASIATMNFSMKTT